MEPIIIDALMELYYRQPNSDAFTQDLNMAKPLFAE